MSTELLRETIKRELPGLLQDDPGLRAYILDLTRQEYPGRQETQDRFYDLLAELRRDREEQARKWDEQNCKWEEQNRKWDEQNRKWDDFKAELQRDREEQARRCEANQVELRRLHEEIMAQAQKHERGIGAL